MRTKRIGPIGKSVSGSELLYGFNPVLEAIRGGRGIKRIILSSKRKNKVDELKREALERKIPVVLSNPEFFDRNFGKGHQGIAAEVYPKSYFPFHELLEIPLRKKETPLFFVLDCIEDPRNLGAILRVADAAGVHGAVIQSHRSVSLSPEVAKVSAGAVEYVPLSLVSNIKHAIREMKKMNITIVGSDEEAKETLWEIDLSVPIGLVIGSEGKGIRKTVIETCDALARIPMQGKINSLNTAVATGIFAFEILRQRMRNIQ
ncbi:MAG: 23S rRNA (guanosine(2251)-2'-O)-methyltransferase RlmB [Nitrospirota bacterium]